MGRYLHILISFIGFQLAAQPHNFLNNSGSTANDEALAVCQGAGGRIYTTGYFSQTVLFDNITFAHSGNGDAYVASQDSLGRYEWAVQISGSQADRGLVLTTDNDGNIFASGTFGGTAEAGGFNMTAAGALYIYL